MPDSGEIVEVYSATNACEEGDCHFVFRFEHCLSEDEATGIMTSVAITHYRLMHPGKFVKLDFEVTERPFDRFTKDELVN
jgi:hypothetical protein